MVHRELQSQRDRNSAWGGGGGPSVNSRGYNYGQERGNSQSAVHVYYTIHLTFPATTMVTQFGNTNIIIDLLYEGLKVINRIILSIQTQ